MNDNLTPAQRYYQRHKEARRAYGREYYLKNRDKILARAEERRAEQDEEEYIANYVAERNGGSYMASDDNIKLVVEEAPIEKIVPVAESPLDAYRGRGVHNKLPARTKNVRTANTGVITVSGSTLVTFA